MNRDEIQFLTRITVRARLANWITKELLVSHRLICLMCSAVFVVESAAQLHTINSISPTSGKPGDVITITGTGFNTSVASNLVMFGATRATVNSVSNVSLTVTVPSGATYAKVAVTNLATRLTVASQQGFTPTFNPPKPTVIGSDFSAKQDFSTATGPWSIAMGDLDGDGRADVVTCNSSNKLVSVFRNNSSSGVINANSLSLRSDYFNGSGGTSVALGDIDGDGKLDIVAASRIDNAVYVLRNTSATHTISFASEVAFSTGSVPISVAIDDLDGDGKLDIAVANNASNTVSVLRNTSSGGNISASSFAPRVDFAAGANPRYVAIGDLDGDGKAEIIVANLNANTISVMRNTGVGGSISTSSFASKVDFATTAGPISVALGDLDGDSKLDLAVANGGGNTVSVFGNSSSVGTITSTSLASRVDFTTGNSPYSVAMGDVDGNGKLDLIVGNNGANSLSVLRSIHATGPISSSTFSSKVDFPTSDLPMAIAVGDLDGDGRADLMSAGLIGSTVSVLRNADLAPTDLPPTISSFTPTIGKPGDLVTIAGSNFNSTAASNVVYFGATRATVTAATATSLLATTPIGATHSPVTVLNTENNLVGASNLSFVPNYSPAKATLTAADFSTKRDLSVPNQPTCLATTDLDGDGKADLVCASISSLSSSSTLSIFRNTGASGSMTSSSFSNRLDFPAGDVVRSVAVGDLDGDGKPDVVGSNEISNNVGVRRNISTSGNIGLSAAIYFGMGGSPVSVVLSDFDGDGKLDVAVANKVQNTVSIRRNTSSVGSISFEARVDFVVGGSPNFLAFGDLDGDGKADLIVINRTGNTFSVLRNVSTRGVINSSSFASKVDFATGNGPLSVALGDLNGDGKTDLVVANNLSNTVSIFRNTSSNGSIISASFAAKVDISITKPTSLALGDFDGDGKLDLVVDNSTSNNYNFSILRNTTIASNPSSISFSAPIDLFTVFPYPFAICDFDGDSKADLAVASWTGVSVFRNADQSSVASKFTSIKASRSAALARNEVRFTAQEDGGTKEYQLEASTNGGQSFEAVSGATTPGSRQAGQFSYQLNDERALTATQTVHYRIKAIGSQTSYSQVVKVDVDGKQMMIVKAYPNPVTDVPNIQLSGTTGQVDIRLLDAQGRVLLSQRQTINGQQTISLATKQLAAGKYLLQATGKGGETLATQSIVKE